MTRPLLADALEREIAGMRTHANRELAVHDLTLDEHDRIVPLVPLASADGFFIRGADGADELNFVKKTWLREYAENATPAASLVFGEHYMNEHHICIEAALEHGAVTIASRQSMPTRICGFAVTGETSGGTLVHFVYVRGRWRKMGVAKLLLAPLLDKHVHYTHRTTMLRDLPIPKSWLFNPYPFLRTE